MNNRGRQVLWAGVYLLIGVVLAMVLSVPYFVAQIRSTQIDNTNKNDSRDEALTIVKDCVQTTGKCYARGQRQTAAILSSAQRIIVLSAACSVDVDPDQTVEERVQQITDCVTERLAEAPPLKP